MAGDLAQCDSCGRTSAFIEAFHIVNHQSYDKRDAKYYCPECWEKMGSKSHKTRIFFYLLIGICGLGFVLISPQKTLGWFGVYFFLLAFLQFLLILPHELGHALSARLMGLPVFQVTIGFGKTFCKWKLFGIPVEFKNIPFGGMTIVGHPDAKFYRLKRFAHVAAGLGVNLIIALATLLPLLHWRAHDGKFGVKIGEDLTAGPAIQKYFCMAVFVANAIIIFNNLVPRKIKTSSGLIPNDGLQLLRVPFLSKKEILTNVALCYAMEGSALSEDKNYLSAKSCFEKGLALSQDNIILLHDYTLNLMHLCEYQKAREGFLKILERQDVPIGVKYLIFNNIAYTDVLLGDQSFLKEADDYSRQAVENLFWFPSAKGTRGAVLVELGQVEEGLKFLQEALEHHVEASKKALNACHIAIGEKKRGNLEESRKFLRMAVGLDPRCELLERAKG